MGERYLRRSRRCRLYGGEVIDIGTSDIALLLLYPLQWLYTCALIQKPVLICALVRAIPPAAAAAGRGGRCGRVRFFFFGIALG